MTALAGNIPVHLSRRRFGPSAELAAHVTGSGLARTTTPFGSAWLATRYEDVRAVLGNSAAFSSADLTQGCPRQAPGDGVPHVPGMSGKFIQYDPPEHTRVRDLLTPEFTAERMRHVEPRVTAVIKHHLDAVESAGPLADLVTAFALPVPFAVICDLIGVPDADRGLVQSLTAIKLDSVLGIERRQQAEADMREYIDQLADRQRAEPREGLLGMLVRDHAGELAGGELSGIVEFLLDVGVDTPSSMLSLGTLLLLENPDQFALLRDNPDAIDVGVEEMLRYLAVVHTARPRIARTDITIGGQAIAEGEIVLCSLPTASRDPALVSDGDRLDLTRTPGSHVAFGHGIHNCIGAPLARLEMRAGFSALLRRFPSLRLAIPSDQIEFRSLTSVHGVRALPVTWLPDLSAVRAAFSRSGEIPSRPNNRV